MRLPIVKQKDLAAQYQKARAMIVLVTSGRRAVQTPGSRNVSYTRP